MKTLTLVLWLSEIKNKTNKQTNRKEKKIHQSDDKGSTLHEALCLKDSDHIQRAL